jgi:hypothetical protein
MGFVSSQQTEQDLVASGEGETSDELDLAYLRDLLSLLSNMEVAAFSAGGITVKFQPKQVISTQPIVRSLTKPQGEVDDEDIPVAAKDGWQNPLLWPSQGGKVLKFDGSFE